MTDELAKLIECAERILITSHLGPDPDAFCSSLLLYKTLRANYPDKKVSVCLEEPISKLEFIDGHNDIEFRPLDKALSSHKPQLLIILDANNLSRCTRHEKEVRPLLDNVQIAVIDHHEPENIEANAAVFINQKSPACAQDIYEVCFEQMNLQRPDGYAQIAMLGIYADTGGFVYENPAYKKTFSIASKLIEDGASIEKIKNALEQYTEDEIKIAGRFFENLSEFNGFSFSYLDDEFASTKDWDPQDIKGGCRIFVNDFSRNVGGRPAGFAIYKDTLADDDVYSVSFRAVNGSVDVAAVVAKLGGGGHKASAGAKIKAPSVEEAIEQVKSAIIS